MDRIAPETTTVGVGRIHGRRPRQTILEAIETKSGRTHDITQT
jgi:hypothetical protein